MTEHPSWETAVFFKVTESQGYANIWQCITSLSILWYITMLTPITVTRWQRRSFDWHIPLWFLLCSLKRTVSLLFSGWGGSFSAGLAENTCEQKLVCIHKWTDLSGRFDWKEMCFFPLSLLSFSLYKTPCEINATQTKYLETARSSSGTLNYGEAWGRWKLLFYFICSFPFSPSKLL